VAKPAPKHTKVAITLGAFLRAVKLSLSAGALCQSAVEVALISLGVEIGPQLLGAIAALGVTCTVAALVRFFEKFLAGDVNMACANTHKSSSTVQGPGPCCAAFSASGLTPAPGVRVVATNKNGKCIVCEVKASTSRSHPGVLVFKRGKAVVAGSNVSCPSTAEGCCALLGQ
jgi:hypothetical protein